jgi:phosphatidylserine decarboxylase
MIITRRSWQEARRYVLGPLAVGGVLLLLGRRSGWLGILAAAASLAFFRDPERPLVPEAGVVYAAADGLVTGVEPDAREPWIPGGRAIRITTFLSLHNVHVNRSPVAGRVADVEEVRGGYFPALFERAEDNHQNRLALDTGRGRVVVVQVAGMVARKIACWVGVGDRVRAGERIGLIHFGSRTDVLLPAGSVDALVRSGDRVRAGQTPLARYREEQAA